MAISMNCHGLVGRKRGSIGHPAGSRANSLAVWWAVHLFFADAAAGDWSLRNLAPRAGPKLFTADITAVTSILFAVCRFRRRGH